MRQRPVCRNTFGREGECLADSPALKKTALRSVGIICECNPFHGGHQHLIRQARASGADVVVCAMSGSFVQRGEAAIVDARLRSRTLLCGGADVVVELPYPFCASGAEYFARAGVEILDRLGVNELWFGSECGDIALLSQLAEAAESEAFQKRYAEVAAGGSPTAEAYFRVLGEVAGVESTCFSNDILGIAYLRALRACRSSVQPVTVKRVGSAYLDESVAKGSYPSATALRRLWRERGLDAILPYLPKEVAALLLSEENIQTADLRYAERWILGQLRVAEPSVIEQGAELGGGLGNRLAMLARESSSLEELLRLAATKKYPNARILRGLLFFMTGITPTDLRAPIAYVRLLAANRTGCDYLALTRRTAQIKVVTRRTELPRSADAIRQAAIEARAWSLYTLCRETAGAADDLWKHGAYIEK